RNGNCRLMGTLAARLSETAPLWARAVAPVAECVAEMLWASTPKLSRKRRLPTRLTQAHRRGETGKDSSPSEALPRRESFCRDWGVAIGQGRTRCASCSLTLNRIELIKAAGKGRMAAQTKQAQARRAHTQRGHASAKAAWRPADLPAWFNRDFYFQQVQ